MKKRAKILLKKSAYFDSFVSVVKNKTTRIVEVGRSMTEMLAVLAVIGVLSIVALSGYRIAMNSYHANELLNNVRLMAANVIQREEIVADATGLINTAEFNPTVSYPMKAEIWNDTADLFVVVADDVQKGVCKSALDKVDDAYTVYVFNDENVDGARFDKDNGICGATNQMQFLFNYTGLCEPSCPNCCYGKCCKNDEICYEGTHECGPNVNKCEDGEVDCGGECCDKTTRSCCGKQGGPQMCCKGSSQCAGPNYSICCDEDANGVPLESDGTNCTCPSPRVLNTETKVCECPDKTKPYFFDKNKGGPLCCAGGEQPVNGECFSITCKYLNSSGYLCYYGTSLCGSYCDSVGTCGYGACLSTDCPEGTTWIPEEGVCEDTNLLRCKPTRKPVNSTGVISTYRCNSRCTVLWNDATKQFEPYKGSCENPVCPNSGTYQAVPNDYTYGCTYSSGVGCYYDNGKWKCQKGQKVCGTDCDKDNIPNCGDCITASFCSNDSESANSSGVLCSTFLTQEEKEACELELYCKKGDILCKDNYCWNVSGTKSLCGYGCLTYYDAFGRCATGSCNTEDNQCLGGRFQKLNYSDSAVWGCHTEKTDGRMECVFSISVRQLYEEEREAMCYWSQKNEDGSYANYTTCGYGCNFDGTNCRTFSNEACSPTYLNEKLQCPYSTNVTSTCNCNTVVGDDDGIYRLKTDKDVYLNIGVPCCAEGQINVTGTCVLP